MAIHSITLAWKIPWTEEPDRLQSVGLQRVGHDWANSLISSWNNSHIHTRLLEKNIALTRWAFVGKVMSLLFNMLSGLVIAFLLWSKRLLISWLQLPSGLILEPKKIKPVTVSTVSPSICHEVMELDAMILDLIPWIYLSPPLYNHKGFDLGHIWMA